MPTTVYFSGSITGGRADVALYREIITALEGAGLNGGLNGGLTVLAGAVAAWAQQCDFVGSVQGPDTHATKGSNAVPL